jgi:hypothetical protein
VAAVVKLLGLGRNVQSSRYGEWLALAAADLSSGLQMELQSQLLIVQ